MRGRSRSVDEIIFSNKARSTPILVGDGGNLLIEPGVPHEVFNLSKTEPVVAVVARSDASEWQNIVNYDRTTASA